MMCIQLKKKIQFDKEDLDKILENQSKKRYKTDTIISRLYKDNIPKLVSQLLKTQLKL